MKDQKYIDLLISRLKLREEMLLNLKDWKKKSTVLEIEISKYISDNPHLINYQEENMMEARIQYTGESLYQFFENLEPFNGDPLKVPDIPILPIPFLREKVWPGLIRAGAIPKKDLIPGGKYLGSCRNSSEATWDGEKFIYTRHKFGDTFEDKINHFQDDNGSDVFIPICKI